MLPEIKVWKVDFDFIINNYLDKSLWKKKWNLFTYKEHVFTINLCRIETEDDVIVFKIQKNNLFWSEIIYYNVNNMSVKILMQQINGAIFRLMETYEERLIKETSGYENIEEARDTERAKLREIAIDFLDNNGVTNREIRDVYIDNYVSKNQRIDFRLQNYIDYYRYNICTDMFLVFCEVTKDKTRLHKVKEANHNLEKLNQIEIDVSEFIKELENGDKDDELYNELEGL